MHTHYDVLIVGAGPGGAIAAHELARGGARVALFEKAKLPRYKTCGGGVVLRAHDGLPERARATFERSARRAELHLLRDDGSELAFAVDHDAPLVSLAMRADFDFALVEAAREAGAHVFEQCMLESLAQNARGVRVVTSRGEFEGAFAIGADGATGSTARLGGWEHALVGSPALEWEVRVPDEVQARFAASVRFDLGCVAKGYGWVFPKREHLSVGILTTRRGASDLAGELTRYLARIGVAPLLSIDRHGSVIPLVPRRGGAARGRVLLVGDAAGLADPLTAEGISNALTSGRLAAGAILGADGDARRARSTYLEALNSTILSELAWARRLAKVLHHEFTRDALFERFGAELARGMALSIAGRSNYRRLMTDPSNYWRLARQLVGVGRPNATSV